MKRLALIPLIALAGCVQTAPVKRATPRLPHFPVAITNAPKAAASSAAVLPQPMPVRSARFRYPNNASNYVWDVQLSSNLTSWITVRSNCAWPPSDNFDQTTSPTNTMQFYRMFGH